MEKICDVFKIAKRIVKTNQDIISGPCIGNGDDVPAVSCEDKKISWRSYHEKPFIAGFAWDTNSLS